jgi:hypothetical protein
VIAQPPAWIGSAANWLANWLNPRRIRAQAAILALCLWTVCAIDFATPGVFDRAGNLKFQDFLPLYVSAHLVAQGRASEIYDQQGIADSIQTVVGHPTRLHLPNLYGPQVALFFVPLTRLSFPAAARIWAATSLLIYFVCIYFVWKSCPALHPHFALVGICAIAFPPLFHFFVRGQNSVLMLACFTAAYLTFRAKQDWLAGIALGCLIFKPQFLVAIPLVLLLAQAWRTLAGLVLSAAAQLAFARIYFGSAVMHFYLDTLSHLSRVIGASELSLAPIQMHSIRSFWSLLIPWQSTPWPQLGLALYILSSIVVIAMAAAAWKSPAPLALRFSALTLAAVLVNPHLFVYDLLVLAPALLLLADAAMTTPQPANSAALKSLIYLTFLLPLFGPLSQWTHLQLSVPAMATLLWLLWRLSTTPSHKFASTESPVV